jgi:hypothetical protein
MTLQALSADFADSNKQIEPNVRHASACRQDWYLSMRDITGNIIV